MMMSEDLDERTLQAVTVLAAAMNRVGRINGIVTEAVRTVLSARSSRALTFASRAFNSMEPGIRGRINDEAAVVAAEIRHDLPRFGPRPSTVSRPAQNLNPDPEMILAKLRDPWGNSSSTAASQAAPTTDRTPRPPARMPTLNRPATNPLDPKDMVSAPELSPPDNDKLIPDPEAVKNRLSEQVADLRRLRSLLQKSV